MADSKRAELIYENTVEANFVKRLNRFSSVVLLDGKEETVHVKNTGRMGELLVPGARVTLQKAANPERKTAYDLISVYKEGLDWVNIDSLAPNMLMKLWLTGTWCQEPRSHGEVTAWCQEPDSCGEEMKRCQEPEGHGSYDLVKPEYRFGNSRVDFYMERDGQRYLTEVKGCTLASEVEEGVGLFPDAPTERGVKHLKELAGAAGEGYHCAIAFVIQMNGIGLVKPNMSTHPEFGQALAEAARKGVRILCYSCQVEADRLWIRDVADVTEKLVNVCL